MSILLISTYDLGRQPFGLASPAAWLRRAGHDVTAVDLSRDTLSPDHVARAVLVAFYLPMHTATRLALPVIDTIRRANPQASLCAYGLYAPLNAELLRAHGVTHVLGPEAEADLVAWADSTGSTGSGLARLGFIQPDRSGLPPLSQYASLQMPDGTRRVVGATEATRGCKHRCRHCPIVPVYDGQFRVVPVDVVLADIRAQVEQGAQHITFGDPDFFNGPTHARRIVEALHQEWPTLTYDATIKIEHLLRQRDLLPVLARTGGLFVTSAVESVDDAVLAKLEKGHTRADFVEAAARCRDAGLTLVPTFVAFTPWTTLEGYGELLDVVDQLGLVDNVAPVQWGIRLLVTWRSRLLELEDIRALAGPFDSKTLTHPWRHSDPAVDELQAAVMEQVGVRATRPRPETFDAIVHLSHARPPSLAPPWSASAGEASPKGPAAAQAGTSAPPHPRTSIPYLNEPWYC